MSSRYHAEIDVTLVNNTHASLVRFVGENKRVLELGAASGYMTSALQQRGCKVTAIEFDPEATEELAAVADEVVVGDLNDPTTMERVTGTFDAVLAGDVLEHLLDPLAVLRATASKLNPGGSVVISIPNVGHADLRLALLQGRFDYQDSGLLDDTHIRFFTYETFLQLLADAGLLIVEIDRILTPVFRSELAVPRDSVSTAVLDAVIAVPESETYQFVVRAVLDDGDEHVRAGSSRLLAGERSIEEARVATARAQLQAIDRSEAELARAQVSDLEDKLSHNASQLNAERARASQLAVEFAAAAADISGLSEELAAARQQLRLACVAESRLSAENAKITSQLVTVRAALDRVVSSRSYFVVTCYRRALTWLAPPGTRRRRLYRALTRRATTEVAT